MDRDQLVAEIISAGGGHIVGRVRLQKVFYLLDQIGLESGFSYEYHHFGPYSADLSEAVADATAFNFVKENTQHRVTDGVAFSTYDLGEHFKCEDANWLGSIEKSVVQKTIGILKSYPATVLEIAATIHWLREVEQVEDWMNELRHRKGIKAEGGRTEEALKLLESIGLNK